MNGDFIQGFLIGFVVVLAIIMLVVYAVRHRNSEACEFDERQIMIRGKAFKIGFFTLVFYNFIYGMSIVVLEKTYIEQTTAFLLGIFIAVCVFAVYCIWNDAYVAINRSPKQFMLLFAVLGAINVMAGVQGILSGEAFHDGMLDYRSTNLFVGAIFVILFITYALKKIFKNEDD